MSEKDTTERETSHAYSDHDADPPIGWDSKTLQEMLAESESLLDDSGTYHGIEELSIKEDDQFEYERMYSRLRGALVNARETAKQVTASPIVRELGELSFQLYTPEGDCIALSTGIIVHVHTGSVAIKWMIEEDYEHDRGIEPGDLFCNNDTSIGNVHTADVHTFVPIFRDGELVAWVDGVTHEVDIGGIVPGFSSVISSSRYEDGFHATCEKIGEDDERFQDWKVRGEYGVRTPEYWDLDEKCRIAGCHMVREAVHEMIDDVGVDRFKRFTREVIEEGRSILHGRVKERLFPGTYRDVSFKPLPMSEVAWNPSAQQDILNHLPVRLEVDADGSMTVDLEGTSPTARHSFNCAEASMEGGLWVTLCQCLVHDGKVNDGSYFAIDTNYPEGTVANAGDHELSYAAAWGTVIPVFNSVWKNVSHGFFARGFREEVVAGYGETGDTVQGGGVMEETDEYFPVSNFDISCMGLGASAVRDGLDWAYAMWNPESDMGDIKEWELVEKGAVHLAKRVKPNSAGYGKYRGGAAWEGLRTFAKSTDVSLYKGISNSGLTFGTSGGMSGGYPPGTNYALWAQDTDLLERFENQDPYPVGDSPTGSFEEHLDGDVTRMYRKLMFPEKFEPDDVFHWQGQDGPRFGDPLEKVSEEVEGGIYTPDVVERVYGVVGEFNEADLDFDLDRKGTTEKRSELRDCRAEESRKFDEFWGDERERILNDEPESSPVRWMYRESFELSEEFTDFWKLPSDPPPSRRSEGWTKRPPRS